MGSWSMSQSHW